MNVKVKVPYLIIKKQDKKGSLKMEDETTKTTPTEPDYSLRNLDQGTIQILIEDKIATGG